MWIDHPAPLVAPPIVPPPPIDQLETWQIKLDAPVAELREDAPAVIRPHASAAVPPAAIEPQSLLLDASKAVADHKPWWLADAAPAAPKPSTVEDPDAMPQITSEPNSDEPTAAAIAAIWLGGQALILTLPEVPEEEPADPRRAKLRGRQEPNDRDD